jgi:hypothetical protein
VKRVLAVRVSVRRAACATCRLSFYAVLALLASAWSSPAQAQTESAAEHFDRALELVERGELAGAAREFERAYELRAHHAVLYNLAQVYAQLGRHRDALIAFQRHLREGGVELDMARRQRVHELIDQQRKKLATLRVHVTPGAAEISIDGVVSELEDEGLLLDPKRHMLKVTLAGYEPHEQTVELAAGEMKDLRIILQRQIQVFELEIACPLPDVVLEVDGQPVRTLPGGRDRISHEVAARTAQVRLSRAGYAPQVVTLDPTFRRHSVACQLKPILEDEFVLATLNLTVSEPGAAVRIDGESYRGQALVPGRHVVTVERSGFKPWTRFIQMAPGETGSLHVQLSPTDAYKAEYERRAKRQRSYAYTLGTAGLVLGATGGILYAWGFERQDRYEARQADIGGAGEPEKGSAEDRANQELRDSIVFYDRVALGLGILGSVSLGGAIWLYLEGDDPDRYEPEGTWSVRASMSGLTLEHVF